MRWFGPHFLGGKFHSIPSVRIRLSRSSLGTPPVHPRRLSHHFILKNTRKRLTTHNQRFNQPAGDRPQGIGSCWGPAPSLCWLSTHMPRGMLSILLCTVQTHARGPACPTLLLAMLPGRKKQTKPTNHQEMLQLLAQMGGD